MDSNEQELMEQIVKFRGSSEITCPHISGVRLRQDCSLCWAGFIRSHTDALIAAAIEECAKKIGAFFRNSAGTITCDCCGQRGTADSTIVHEKYCEVLMLRSLTPPSARRALELREAKARITEAAEFGDKVNQFLQAIVSHAGMCMEDESNSALSGAQIESLVEKAAIWIRERYADLERRRAELEGEKHG